jgi:putative FmdB family regulatory protein
MPIYAYKCASCGHAKDVLQKMSDAPLSVCPACGEPTFQKQVTAAGFQLKGSGWYVTDFRNGGTAATAPKAEGSSEAKADSSTASPAKAADAAAQAPAAALAGAGSAAAASAPATPTTSPSSAS